MGYVSRCGKFPRNCVEDSTCAFVTWEREQIIYESSVQIILYRLMKGPVKDPKNASGKQILPVEAPLRLPSLSIVDKQSLRLNISKIGWWAYTWKNQTSDSNLIALTRDHKVRWILTQNMTRSQLMTCFFERLHAKVLSQVIGWHPKIPPSFSWCVHVI